MSQELNSSQFHMWRAMVALVFADGKEHPEEVAFFEDRFTKINASTDQINTLKGDLHSHHEVMDFFNGITEPRDRSQFIYFARILFWSDGDFHYQEEEILKRLTEKVMSKVDLETIMREVDKSTADFWALEEKKEKERPLREKFTDAIIFWEDL